MSSRNQSLDELIAQSVPAIRLAPPLEETPPISEGYLRRKRIARLTKRIRSLEREALRHFRPLPHVESFHRSKKPIRLLVGSNQSSKTLHMLAELSRAVTGQDPYHKYPKKNGRAIIVGFDADHLADPLYRKLFLPGEIKLIPDEETGKLRAVRPDPNDPTRLDPYDLAYKEKWQDAPPLIPRRMVAHQAWEESKKDIPRVTTLTNGWQLLWRSSNSRPPHGRQIHLAVLDEEMRSARYWINEMIPRMLRYHGKLIWAATGQEGGPELLELVRQSEAGSPYVDVLELLLEQNPFIDESQRAFMRSSITDEAELEVRYHGKIALFKRLVYPDYAPNGIHGCEPFPVPEFWARYISLDPARQRCGTLFLAVDPEEKHIWVYDGLAIEQVNALDWARAIANRQATTKFEAAIIDQRMGRSRQVGIWEDISVAAYYRRAMQEVGIQIRREGPLSGFFPGSDDVEARTLALRGWMIPRGAGPFAGTPKLQVMRGRVPALDREISRANLDPRRGYKRSAKSVHDLLDCLEYAAHFEPTYHAPESLSYDKPSEDDPWVEESKTVAERFREKRRRRRIRERMLLMETV